jgi:hypothetical protein
LTEETTESLRQELHLRDEDICTFKLELSKRAEVEESIKASMLERMCKVVFTVLTFYSSIFVETISWEQKISVVERQKLKETDSCIKSLMKENGDLKAEIKVTDLSPTRVALN